MKLRTKASYNNKVSEREEKNKKIAYQAALEGMVLLENDGTLPIRPGKIALYGAGAEMTIKGGTGSGEVNERHSTSIMEGLQNAGFEITTKSWLYDYARAFEKGKEEYARQFRKKLIKLDIVNFMSDPYRYPIGRLITDNDVTKSDTDTCIYVVSRQAGEGGDRKLDNGDNNLSQTEISNIKKCAKSYQKTIVVINVGASFDMSFLDRISGINAVIFFCQQGTEGGNAFADVVSGNVSPSGRLTDTWAKKYDDIPYAREFSYLNGNLKDEFYKEGIYVGYRYFDTFQIEPRYEFGYGLGYSEFDIAVKEVRVEKSRVLVTAAVKNAGSQYRGKEVAQLYISCPDGKLEKEHQKLAAFAKTRELGPGETEEVVLSFDLSQMASYDMDEACFLLEKGDYVLRLGKSSRKTSVCGVIVLDKDVIISKHETICKPIHSTRGKLEELSKASMTPVSEAIPATAPRLQMDSGAFSMVAYEYKTPEMYSTKRIDSIINHLSTEEMVDLVVGTGMFGNSYFTAPGAVGNTTSKFARRGITNVALSDGPAGLRLQKISAVTDKGKVKMVEALIDFMNYLPGFVKKVMLADPDKHTLIYQFTTAFPVEMALAQTWNVDILEQVGYAVGVEMEEYGITYWLGPGMNIHRNPLCGRNFEYYSEDPILTGKLAAATVRGVQKIAGNYATVKHYAANNQEDNRNGVSSNMSERTLREIYLKGFEIAVREGKAKSVMTSYNRLNGVYTANSYDLCTKVLRNEWGFDGVVMTDWFSTAKNFANNGLAMSAGNDLIMPGTGGNKKEIMKELKDGTIERTDIERCCRNVLRQILESRTQKELDQERKQKS